MRIAAVIVALFLVILAWLLRPLPELRPPVLRASADYADASRRIDDLRARDTIALFQGCGTEVFLHGHRTPRAIVLLHGITNCPLQFHDLAVALEKGGDNVLVPRVAYHGLANRMTTALARLTAEDLAACATECVGIARGLGDTVVVVGLSTSGVAAAWAAQRLDDVDRAVIIAPAFSPPRCPTGIVPLVTRAGLRLPNVFVWWDRKKKEALPGPPQCYPRFPTRALAESYRLGEDVWRSLRSAPPRARDLAVVTTLADHAVANARADSLAARWRARGARVRQVAFPARFAINHDMVDPKQVGARPDLVYPRLVALVRGETLPQSW